MLKMDDVLAAVKLTDFLRKKKEEEVEEKATKNVWKTVLIILGIVVVAAVVAKLKLVPKVLASARAVAAFA